MIQLVDSRALVALASVLALMAFVAAPGRAVAEAQRLEPALQAYRSGELDVALQRFERALQTPGNQPEDLLQIHLHLGVLRAAMGQQDRARRAFEAALALDPTLSPPADLGSLMQGAFQAARDARQGRSLGIQIEPVATAADGPVTELRVAAAHMPQGLVWALRLSVTSHGGTSLSTHRMEGAGPTLFTLPGATALGQGAWTVEAEALDEHGGVLARASFDPGAQAPGHALAPAVSDPGGDPAPPPGPGPVPGSDEADPQLSDGETGGTGGQPGDRRDDPPGPWYTRPSVWMWVGIGVAVLGGVTVGVVLGTAETTYDVGAPRVP